MKPSEAIQQHRKAIRQIVYEHRAANPRIFGSVAEGKDHDGSDLDLLVDPLPEASLLDVAMIQVELEALLGVPVDVVTPNALATGFRAQALKMARAL